MAFWSIAYLVYNWGFETIVFYGVGLLTLCPQCRGSRLCWSLLPEGNTLSGSYAEAHPPSVTLVVVTLLQALLPASYSILSFLPGATWAWTY